MKKPDSQFLLQNWQQRLTALVAAIIIWLVVNNTITITKTFPNVPIRIINLPEDKTIEDGLLPNGYLTRRISLTLKGNKSALDDFEPGDLEVVIDASREGDEWVVDITKKNLISLNPDVDLSRNLTEVIHSEFVLSLSRLVTADIPVTITFPVGEPPKGYQFLDIWPQRFTHTVSGPEERVEELRQKGFELTFNLNRISREELDEAFASANYSHLDEVSYFVPLEWKRVSIPFHNNALEELNDPDAISLHIEFLRKDLQPLEADLPVRAYFPPMYSQTLNPDTYELEHDTLLEKKHGLTVLTMPLFVRDVSRQFLEVVKDNLELTVIAAPRSEQETLQWSVQFINPTELENRYVDALMREHFIKESEIQPVLHERFLRQRFHDYMRAFKLFASENKPLALLPKLQGSTITLEEASHEELEVDPSLPQS